jgi:serine/threonine protein kinase
MAGDLVGRYELQELLGRGATGAVWRAVDTKWPNDRSRDVAVKRLSVPESESDRERLQREANALAKLDHPNVIRVRDVLDDGAGIALVLDLADAGTLADRLRRDGTLPPSETIRLLGPIASALAAAHHAGLVHRDVKPDNIFLTSAGQALLGDFGIAHDAARTQMTRTDLAVGTAAYLDPETLNGVEPGPASDQYAFGVTLYEALTGRLPFTGPVPMAVVRAAEEGRRTPIDRMVVPPNLAAAVERAFARNPTDRFASMDDLADAMNGHTDQGARMPDSPGQPASITRTTAFRRRSLSQAMADAPPVRSRRRRLAVIGATVGLLTFSGIGGLVLRDRRSSELSDPAPVGLPDCSQETQPQCVRSFLRTPQGIEVTFGDQRVATYQVGERNDALRVANWLCGERATLALYRPRTGALYFFDSWPDGQTDEPIRVAADRTGIMNATALLPADRNGDGCADMALQTAKARTWFLPAQQTERLVGLPDLAPTLSGATS